MELTVGTVVRAIAGRDRDGYFVVTGREGAFVTIADGKSRPIGQPKRKNIKHLRATRKTILLHEITDKKLRAALREITASETE